MQEPNTLRDMIVGALIAMFSALMWQLYEPENPKHTLKMKIGRVGVAAIISLAVGAIAGDLLHWSPRLVYAACGISGILGERALVAILYVSGKRFGFNITLRDEKEVDDAQK